MHSSSFDEEKMLHCTAAHFAEMNMKQNFKLLMKSEYNRISLSCRSRQDEAHIQHIKKFYCNNPCIYVPLNERDNDVSLILKVTVFSVHCLTTFFYTSVLHWPKRLQICFEFFRGNVTDVWYENCLISAYLYLIVEQFWTHIYFAFHRIPRLFQEHTAGHALRSEATDLGLYSCQFVAEQINQHLPSRMRPSLIAISAWITKRSINTIPSTARSQSYRSTFPRRIFSSFVILVTIIVRQNHLNTTHARLGA